TYTTAKLLPYIGGEFVGAMLGAFLVWVLYKDHFDVTCDQPGVQRACFCTAPSIRNIPRNFFSEFLATFVLLYAALSFTSPAIEIGSLGKWAITTLIWSIGLSLGGTTGYAINPCRDLGPRIMHAILPMKGKGDSDWSYSWVPVLGPIMGAAFAAILFGFLH